MKKEILSTSSVMVIAVLLAACGGGTARSDGSTAESIRAGRDVQTVADIFATADSDAATAPSEDFDAAPRPSAPQTPGTAGGLADDSLDAEPAGLDGVDSVAQSVPAILSGADGADRSSTTAPPPPNTGQAGVTLSGPGVDNFAIQTLDRRVIRDAALTLEVENAQETAIAIRVVAESVGGFVDELAIRGGPDGDGGLIVVRVPVLAFFDALEQIGELGVVLDQNVQTQDVTEEFVDLEAQERNLRAQEVRVLDLLKDSRGLNEILLLENELSRLRGLVEQVQGRLNFLERRTQLSTIRVTMRRPVMIESVTRVSQPPSASLTVAVDDVDGARVSLEAVVEQAGGVVERSTVRVSGAEESATLRLLLPRADFDDVIRAAEALGEVRDKTVEKGEERVSAAPGVVLTEPDGPDAPFGLLLVSNVEPAPIETNDGDQTWLAILLGTLLGLVVLAAGVAIHWLIRRRPPASA